MGAPYPMPTNMTGLSSMGVYANTLTGGIWGVGILMMGTIILYVVLQQRYTTRVSVMTTSLIMSFLAILWRFANQITDFVMIAFIVAAFGAILYYSFSKDEFTD